MDSTVRCAASALLDTWSSHSWTEGIQLETVQDMIIASNGEFRRLEVGGPVLGIMADSEMEWHEGRMRLASDEVLVCYTDGATEAVNAVGEAYGEARLIEAVRENMLLTPYKLCTALYANMRTFIGATPQVDDTTFLAIKRMERGPAAAISAGAGAGIL